MSKSRRQYRDIWRKMLEKCNNAKHLEYHLVGGRGITLCERWWDFELWLSDVGSCPNANHHFRRDNPEDGFHPENAGWRTRRTKKPPKVRSVNKHKRYVSKSKPRSEYIIWRHMVKRCANPDDDAYSDYGARGITVCDRWLSFDNFMDDMGDRPYPSATLERKNVDEGYNPDNVVWLDLRLQNRNKRTTFWVTHNGQIKCLMDVAEEEGIPYLWLWKQLRNKGLDLETAILKRKH